MALPADVLAKVLAFVPADLQMTSSLRVASKYAKERVDTRWWTAQVQDMKAFMDGHACLFAADPVSVEGNEDVSIEEQQEAFARNILLWVKPLLVNQPWSSEVHDHEVHHDDDDDDDDDATGEITPRAAHINLRRAMTNLSERRNGVLQDIRQQARFIEGRHLRQRHTARQAAHTVVSRSDRRQMEADMEDEARSEDARSGSLPHTEMTRDGNFQAEMMTILMQQGISEEQAHAVCRQIQQRGLMDPSDRSDETSWSGESEASDLVNRTCAPSPIGLKTIELCEEFEADPIKRLFRASDSVVDASVVAILLQAAVDKDAKNNDYTALHVAAQAGHQNLINVLLQAGADQDAVPRDFNLASRPSAPHSNSIFEMVTAMSARGYMAWQHAI
ncbi:unnamed protein product [Durusdinium trenchii]|uniref:F-box domain-containing protein n=1 Tax=Durusdinium trenchii TaxID=1381693 RepID=A0ABP0N7S0_9DINO